MRIGRARITHPAAIRPRSFPSSDTIGLRAGPGLAISPAVEVVRRRVHRLCPGVYDAHHG